MDVNAISSPATGLSLPAAHGQTPKAADVATGKVRYYWSPKQGAEATARASLDHSGADPGYKAPTEYPKTGQLLRAKKTVRCLCGATYCDALGNGQPGTRASAWTQACLGLKTKLESQFPGLIEVQVYGPRAASDTLGSLDATDALYGPGPTALVRGRHTFLLDCTPRDEDCQSPSSFLGGDVIHIIPYTDMGGNVGDDAYYPTYYTQFGIGLSWSDFAPIYSADYDRLKVAYPTFPRFKAYLFADSTGMRSAGSRVPNIITTPVGPNPHTIDFGAYAPGDPADEDWEIGVSSVHHYFDDDGNQLPATYTTFDSVSASAGSSFAQWFGAMTAALSEMVEGSGHFSDRPLKKLGFTLGDPAPSGDLGGAENFIKETWNIDF